MLAKFSNENRIAERLKEMNCADRAFARFNRVVGSTRYFEAMTGKPGKHFSEDTARRLFTVLHEMGALQHEVVVPVDWSKIENRDQITSVTTKLVANRTSREIGVEALRTAQEGSK